MIAEILGIDSDYIIIGLIAVTLIMFIMIIINMVQMRQLKKKYKMFMSGENAQSLESILMERLEQIDALIKSNADNEENIKKICQQMNVTFNKYGLVKYDAFNEMGGKLSFTLALLNESEDGFIINAMHSREGCYTYIKEVIGGNSIAVLSGEEKEALEVARKSNH